MCRAAYEKQGRPGADVLGTEEAVAAFRHEHVKAACGADGLRGASNDDYLPILRRFQMLAGDAVGEWESALRETTEHRRQIEHNLAAALRRGGLPMAFADRIALDTYGRRTPALTDEQLRKVAFTVANRVKARAKKKGVPA